MTANTERLRDALNDDEIETLLEAVRIALEEKDKAVKAAAELRMGFGVDAFGIPALQGLQARLQAAYEIEERGA